MPVLCVTMFVCVYSFAEGSVLLLFAVTACLWVTRKPDIFPGWSNLLGVHAYAFIILLLLL